MKRWAVYAPAAFWVVEGDTIAEAKQKALDSSGLGHKPYLARDWNVHEATSAEIDRYAAMVDALPRSRTTAASAKNPKRSARERLL